MRALALGIACVTLIAGCEVSEIRYVGPPPVAPVEGSVEGSGRATAPPPNGRSADDEALAEVARVHGGAGPWAVAGYRMGRHALARLGLERQSFDLEVIHKSPRTVQFSCVADGASAATGASLGKLNLSFIEADASAISTTYRRKSTGQSITLRPSASFRARFLDVPMDHLAEAGRAVIALPDAEIFEEAGP